MAEAPTGKTPQVKDKDEKPKLPRAVSLAGGGLAVAKSLRKALAQQGKQKVADGILEVSDDRVLKEVPFPETGRLDTNVIFDDSHRPALNLIRQHFLKEGRLTTEAAIALMRAARDLMKDEPNVVEVVPPLIVVGDIHGQFFDLLSIFEISGQPPATKFLFLGDYVDRGDFSTETILYLCAMKVLAPQSVIMLRGNHESRLLGEYMTYLMECEHKYSAELFKETQAMFDALPLAAVVKGTIYGNCLCVHGGIGPNLRHVSDINRIHRFVEIPADGFFCDLVWSDPVSDYDPSDPECERMSRHEWEQLEFVPNAIRHSSYQYGPKAVSTFLQENGLCCIIRGHQVQQEGYMEHFVTEDAPIAPVLTVFSAPNYCDQYGNKGAFLIVYPDRFEIQQLRSVAHPYYLPDFSDAFTYSIPFLLEHVVGVLQQLVLQLKSDRKALTEEEKKQDEILAEKTKRLYAKSSKAREAQDEYRKIQADTYHKNMPLFLQVLKRDAKNEAFPERAKRGPVPGSLKRCMSGHL